MDDNLKNQNEATTSDNQSATLTSVPLAPKVSPILVLGIGLGVGVITSGLSYLFDLVTKGCSAGTGTNCFLSGYIGTIIVLSIALAFGVFLLHKFKIARPWEAAIFSTVALYAMLAAAQWLPIPIYLGLTAVSVLYAFTYLLFYWFFDVLKLDPTTKLAIGVLLAAGLIWGSMQLGAKVAENQYQKEQDQHLGKLGFQLYAPTGPTGRFKFEDFSSNEFSDPPYVELNFSLSLKANVYKMPDYFKPPANCGQTTPWSTSLGKFDGTYECPLAFTTPKGRKVYGYSQDRVLRVGEKPKAESYFTQLGDTVLSIEYFSSDTTEDEIATIVDAFEPVSFEQLKNLNQVSKQKKEDLKNSLEQYVKFDIYAPKYIPSGYKLKRYLLGNVKDNTDPQMLVEVQKGSDTNNPVSMYQFRSKKPFNPPEDCGQSSAESEGQYTFEVHCQIITITPKGIKIYATGYKSTLEPATQIYLVLGSTKITIYPWYSTLSELVKFVDGLALTPLSKVRYEKL